MNFVSVIYEQSVANKYWKGYKEYLFRNNLEDISKGDSIVVYSDKQDTLSVVKVVNVFEAGQLSDEQKAIATAYTVSKIDLTAIGKNKIIIESTPEGKAGSFYEMWTKAEGRA